MTEPDWAEPGRWCPKCGADASEVVELMQWGSPRPVAELRRFACCEMATDSPRAATAHEGHLHLPAKSPRHWWTPDRKFAAWSWAAAVCSAASMGCYAAGWPVASALLLLATVGFLVGATTNALT